MNRKEVIQLKKSLTQMICYDTNCIEQLLMYLKEVRRLDTQLAGKSTFETTISNFDDTALAETEIFLNAYLKNPKKRMLQPTFSEYRQDILNQLNCCIDFGDQSNLWD